MLEIFIINALSDNYIYLLRNEHKNLTSVIDPGEAEPVIKFLDNKGWHLDEVINTHHHHDHIGGNKELLHIYKSRLIAPSYETDRISNIDILVSDNETVNIAGIATKVFHTPGHTLGHVCFYMTEEKCLFSGDTLFYLGCGRVFEGDMNMMYNSINKISALPDKTTIYCSHEYTIANGKFALNVEGDNKSLIDRINQVEELIAANKPTIPTTLELEKQTNPFLRTSSPSIRNKLGLKNASEVEVFSALRTAKDNF